MSMSIPILFIVGAGINVYGGLGDDSRALFMVCSLEWSYYVLDFRQSLQEESQEV